MAGNSNSGRPNKNRQSAESTQQNQFTVRCPSYLCAKAKGFWKTYVKYLTGIIQNKDEFALARLCQLRVWWLDVQKILNKEGLTYEHTLDRGVTNIKKRPEVDLLKEYHAEISRLESKFGLTPKDAGTARKRPAGKNMGAKTMRGKYS